MLFGSRATGTNTVSSDVDIALFGDRLTLTDIARLAAGAGRDSDGAVGGPGAVRLDTGSGVDGSHPMCRGRVVHAICPCHSPHPR